VSIGHIVFFNLSHMVLLLKLIASLLTNVIGVAVFIVNKQTD